MEEIKKQIIEYLYEYGEKCGGECGTLAVELISKLGLTSEECKTALNELYLAHRIVVRDGAQGRLIFLNYETYENDKRNTEGVR